MKADRHFIMLEINPERYPEMELTFNEITEHEDKLLETKVTFPKEFWLNLADTLKQVGYYGEDEPTKQGFNFISQRIMAEIEAENRRVKFKEAYESFADFIVEINKRTDLDNVRKAQMIHDMACQLKLEA
ncbi:MAG: hypothetical protein PVH35_04810 [Syntrophobacterales bacterium]|jgi:hypothetical protein